MTTKHQRETPIKNVGGSQMSDTNRDFRQGEAGSPAQQEAVRRASEPAIELGPDSPLLAEDDPERRLSANKRGGGSHGGTSGGAGESRR